MKPLHDLSSLRTVAGLEEKTICLLQILEILERVSNFSTEEVFAVASGVRQDTAAAKQQYGRVETVIEARLMAYGLRLKQILAFDPTLKGEAFSGIRVKARFTQGMAQQQPELYSYEFRDFEEYDLLNLGPKEVAMGISIDGGWLLAFPDRNGRVATSHPVAGIYDLGSARQVWLHLVPGSLLIVSA